MSSLQEKLYNQEQVPPARVWDKINAALDESYVAEEFPSKLYNAEVIPPAQVWDKIAGSLETPVVPMQQRRAGFYRYAAAAVLIGIIVLGVVKWMNRNKDETGDDLAGTTAPTTTGAGSKSQAIAKDSAATNDLPAIKNEDMLAGAELPEPVKPRASRKTRVNEASNDNTDLAEPTFAYNEAASNLADRYIMYMTPDGGIVRMSKKMGNMVCCVSGQDTDPDCKDQLRKLQEKLACTPVGNGNFMDILSLVNTLNTDL